jgi:threonine synthase
MTVTMGEGNTPLVESARTPALFFKLESSNPSGSYKDRFIAAEIAQVLARGGQACVATSSGNTGSSLAAYCARFHLPCVILVNQDAPEGKLAQMRAHGARVIPRAGVRDVAQRVTESVFAQLRQFTASSGSALVVSAFRYRPVGMRGVQAISSEIAAQLPEVKHVFVPVGGGGLYAAIVRGFEGQMRMPRIHIVQPEGCPTVLRAARESREVSPVESTTHISGLSVPFDIDASLALELARKHDGLVLGVSDEDVFAAQRTMLREEGIYAEPAGAAALAGYRQAIQSGAVSENESVVCLVTGHGFKDPQSRDSAAAAGMESPVVEGAQVLRELVRSWRLRGTKRKGRTDCRRRH